MSITDLIEDFSPTPWSIHQQDSIKDALAKFSESRSNMLPVINGNNEVIGSLSLFDLLLPVQDSAKLNENICRWMEDRLVPLKSDKNHDPVVDKNNFRVILADQNDRAELFNLSSDSSYFWRDHEKLEYELLRQITENVYCGIVTINETGKVVVYNASAQRLLKLKKEDILGKNIKTVRALEDFSKLILDHKGQGRHKLSLGDVTFVINLTPLFRNNLRIGVLAVFHESAKTECVSQELKVTETLLKEINIFIESSYDGLFVTDNQGRVIRVNAAWEKIFSVSRQDVIGQKAKDLVKRGVYGKSAAQEVLDTGKSATVMFENKGRKILATGTPVFNSQGEITTVVVNVRDITQLEDLRCQLEKQQQLTEKYSQEIKEIRRQQQVFPGIICHSKIMVQVMDMVSRVAEVDSTVLITGESGVGKEMIAGLLHKLSPRRNGPMIKINCSAIPQTLLESELFGYERGAFTGASVQGKIGLFELANGGTLMLDEIGETAIELQAKLLRVIQEKEIIKVGGSKSKKIDVRIVAATNRDLKKMIQERTFREDLFYRLNVIRINVPSLRERTEDIVPLSLFFLEKYNKKYNKNKRLSSFLINSLNDYNWPGNIRELENLIENLVILARNDEITVDDLPENYKQPVISDQRIVVNGVMPIKKAIELVELQLIQNARERYGSTRKIANALGINQSTVVRKMAVQRHQ
ncbi:sigma 54-interacting transcriptional regulator [Candidatus Formimonas warabiya]|uniref:sigma 54-interacting transcriptional regulator n=1 Tax=Formimonas warabiya TaxID=1761012 RepID=UPI001BE44222|nr:sigma 54-interacting transcriptional regulator [Candidatus Formimonas warabiya]